MKATSGSTGTIATGVTVISIGAATVFALTLGATYNWPDYYHTDYGFPLVWGTHTTDTFIGPVDKWAVILGNLALDLVFWLAALSLAVVAIQILAKRRVTPGNQAVSRVGHETN